MTEVTKFVLEVACSLSWRTSMRYILLCIPAAPRAARAKAIANFSTFSIKSTIVEASDCLLSVFHKSSSSRIKSTKSNTWSHKYNGMPVISISLRTVRYAMIEQYELTNSGFGIERISRKWRTIIGAVRLINMFKNF